ncbi:uncharacterized protein LOC121388828 [Gigantopelta aegis]|uniref:uncharacterized protein LOC121388828 n=1 Tax=Gigantopelta aegis TaxID=1735272 RepID=UPI001B888640|nr:uncharacterized protein LOC121388828 [Gigantopelta aegis]
MNRLLVDTIHNRLCSSSSGFNIETHSSSGIVKYFGLPMPDCFERFCIKKECINGTMTPTFVNDERSNCFCDSVCLVYGDCCPDFYLVCLDEANSSLPVRPGNYEWVASRVETMTSSSSQFRLAMILFKHKTCFEVKRGLFPQYIWVIGECPASYNVSSITNRCQNQSADVIGTVPATHTIHRFITFQNVFCAVCHGVPLSDLQMWETSLECVPDIDKENITFDSLLHFLNNSDCVLRLQFPMTIELRYCHISDISDRTFTNRNSQVFVGNLLQTTTPKPTGTVSTCASCDVDVNETNQNTNISSGDSNTLVRVLELCGAYRYLVAFTCSVNRNVHCSNLGTDIISVNKYECMPGYCPKFVIMPYFVSLGVLFSFSEHGVTLCSLTSTCKSPRQKACLVDEVYDYYLDRCRPLVCPVGKSPINGSCIITGSLVGDLQHQIFPHGFQAIRVNITYNNDSCKLNIKLFSKIMDSSFQTAGTEPTEENALNSVSKNISGNKIITLVLASSCFQYGKNQINNNIYNYRYSSQFLNALFKVLIHSHNGRNIAEATVSTFPSNEDLACENNTHIMSRNGTLEEINESWFVYHGFQYYHLENIPFVIKLGFGDDFGASLVEYIICKMNSPLLDCPMISYPENETESQNETLHILGTGLYFSFGSFVFHENQVYVCSNFTRSYLSNGLVHFFNFNPTQGLLTLLCSVVSVFSLALMLIIYFALPELRNIPGKIVMSVSVSLLTSQSLLLLSNLPTGLFCKVLGIVLHWTWLSTFVWMTMMATNLVKTFTAKSTVLHSYKSFLFYVAIAVSIPTLIVGVCVAVDMAEIPNMVIGYGDNGVCWISNKKALLAVFGVPLAILLLINVVCFVITICSIERSMDISKTASSTRKDRVKCIIYCKLLIITGLTWAFGFTAGFSNSDELWYVFIVLNGSQGLYIFICFVFNRRVLRLLKTKLSKTKDRKGLSHESRTLSTQM